MDDSKKLQEADSFDELTRGIARGELSRGRAIKMAGAAVLGSGLAGFILPPGVAEARRRRKKRRRATPACTALPPQGAICPGPRDESLPSTPDDLIIAQTFTAPRTGQLTGVQFELTSSAGGNDFVLEIRTVGTDSAVNPKPSDTVLASATVQDAPAASLDSPTTIYGTFASPTTVTACQRYALVIKPQAAGQNYSVGIRRNDPCPGGELFFDAAGNGIFNGRVDKPDLVYAIIIS